MNHHFPPGNPSMFTPVPPRKSLFLSLVVLMAVGSACNFPSAQTVTIPTLNATESYATVNARLTIALALTPTVIPSDPATQTSAPPSPTLMPSSLSSPSPAAVSSPSPTAKPTRACDQAGAGIPIDVTIPDDTQMLPSQLFTKVWRLQNTGACAWTKDYTARLFSGERMNAQEKIQLRQVINPGESVDIPVDMVAPEKPGTYQGNWKLQNAANQWFGIGPNGSAPFWVRIIVVEPPTATASPVTPYPPLPIRETPNDIPTPTPPETATPTPTLELSITPTLTATVSAQTGDFARQVSGGPISLHQIQASNRAPAPASIAIRFFLESRRLWVNSIW